MKTIKHCLFFLALIGFVGCSSSSVMSGAERTEIFVEQDYTETPPGVVEYVWVEPMVDVIDVPPGLDPEGVYWMPGHQEIVEIRQGRWKYYKAPKNGAAPKTK